MGRVGRREKGSMPSAVRAREPSGREDMFFSAFSMLRRAFCLFTSARVLRPSAASLSLSLSLSF